MSLIPQEKTEYEKEESGPVGGKRGGPGFGDEKDPTGAYTQEDSGPTGGTDGKDGLVPVTNAFSQEESTPSRDIGHGKRVDEVKGDV